MKKQKISWKIKNTIKIASITSFCVLTYCTYSFANVPGDINKDGTCNVDDTKLLKWHLVQKQELTEEQKEIADLNNDGILSITDLSLLKGKFNIKEDNNGNEENGDNEQNNGNQEDDGSQDGEIDEDRQVKSIEVAHLPNKIRYIYGEEFDSNGLSIIATYDNGDKEDVTGSVTLSTFNPKKLGTQVITVSYEGKVTTFRVSVGIKQEFSIGDRVTGINIEKVPNKTIYKYGEELDITGLKVVKKWLSGNKETVYNYNVTGYNPYVLGKQKLVIEYVGTDENNEQVTYTTSMKVEVIDYIDEIEILQSKDVYKYGEDFSLQAIAKYASGKELDITDLITVSGYDSMQLGKQTVQLEYTEILKNGEINNFNFEIEVEVIDYIEEIEILQSKNVYKYGENLSLQTIAKYASGKELDITDLITISGYDSMQLGKQNLQIKYTEILKNGEINNFNFEVEVEVIDYIEEIEILQSKNVYKYGENLSLQAIAKYATGKEVDITKLTTVSGYDSMQLGKQTVQLEYTEILKNDEINNFSFEIEVEVINYVEEFNILIDKTTYKYGEDLEYKAEIIYADGQKADATNDSNIVTNYNNQKLGKQEVEFKYLEELEQLDEINELTASVEINVVDYITNIEITSQLNKIEYQIGEELDLTGLEITITYASGKTEVITEGFTVSGYDKNAVGTQVITITYTETISELNENNEFSTTFEIIVSEEAPEEENIPVTGINLNKSIAIVKINETLQLTATIEPENATNKNVTWTSSDKNIATVDEKGLVRGISKGNAIITVIAEDGELKAHCDVAVVDLSDFENISVTGISLNKTAITLQNGKTESLIATILPENATNKNVTWTSSNESIAKVSAGGFVTAVNIGEATITATTEDGGYKAACIVNVTRKVDLSINKTEMDLDVGDSEIISIQGFPDDEFSVELEYDKDFVKVETSEVGKYKITATNIESLVQQTTVKFTVTIDGKEYQLSVKINLKGLIAGDMSDDVIANNTTYLQRKVDETYEVGGGTVNIPSGTYYFGKGGTRGNISEYVIKCKDNVKIVGAGTEEDENENTTLIPYGEVTTDGGRDMFYFNDYAESNYKNPNYLTNADFKNFIIDGMYITGGSYNSSGKGFMINLCKECDWENVIVKNTYGTGFGFDAPINCKVNNCVAINCGRKADKNSQGASGFGIGIGFSKDESVLISNSTALGNMKYGFFFEHQSRFDENFNYYPAQKGNFVVQNCIAGGNKFDFGGERAQDVKYTNCSSLDKSEFESKFKSKFEFEFELSKAAFHFENVSVRCRLENCTVKPKFIDIDENDFFYDAAYWSLNNGIVEGNYEWEFEPETELNRATAIELLWRLAERPGNIVYGDSDNYLNDQIDTGFEDVPGSHENATAIKWAVEEEISNGTSSTKFSPGNLCSRATFLVFLYRYAESPEVEVGDIKSIFSDVENDAFYAKALRWAYSQGIVTGTEGGNFLPDDICIKSEAILLMYRYVNSL